MNYENLKLAKDMYKAEGGFTKALENLDPTKNYTGGELASLDAFQRQLKRFDIKVGGASSDIISKFFQTSDSSTLFPEYVSRAVAGGANDAGIIEEIIASKTETSSMDYRSITTDVDDGDDFDASVDSDGIGEGNSIPETSIKLNDNLVSLKKRGRLLKASYEAIKFQRVDVFTVALKQIGAYIAKMQLKDAVKTLVNGAEKILTAGAKVEYSDLLALWGKFDEFEMNTMLVSPDMMLDLLAISEFKDPACGLNFQATGALTTPLGAKLLKSNAVPNGTIIALDKNFALEMVTAGGITVEYDKLIDSQLERAAVTAITGFSKIFPDAVKILVRG